MRKVVVDTNYFIYASNKESKFYFEAVSLLQDKNIEICITGKIVSEIWAVLSKQSIASSTIFSIIENILENSTLLLPKPNTVHILNKLCEKYKVRGNQVYDMEIVATAMSNGINTIASFNTKDFEKIHEIKLI